MKISFIFILISILLVCCDSKNYSCGKIGEFKICSGGNGLYFFYSSEGKLSQIRDSINTVDYFFYNGDINKLKEVNVAHDGVITQIVKFRPNGSLETIKFANIDSNAMVLETFNNNSSKVEFYEYFENIGQFVKVAYLTLSGNRKDTSNFFYYKFNKNGVVINTDIKAFKYDWNTMDSIIAEVSEEHQRITIDTPMEHVYIPNLSQVNTKRSYKNSLYLKGIKRKFIGTLWTFHKKPFHTPYSYHILSASSSTTQKLNELNNRRLTIQGRMVKNEDLLNNIILSGLYCLNGKGSLVCVVV